MRSFVIYYIYYGRSSKEEKAAVCAGGLDGDIDGGVGALFDGVFDIVSAWI